MTRDELLRMARFAIVGISNTVLTVAAFAVLTRTGLAPAVSSALAFAAGAANGYRLNRTWTFRHSGGGARTMLRYVAVQLLGAALSGAGVALASSDLELRHLLAEAVVLPIVTLITYTASRRLVFADPAVA